MKIDRLLGILTQLLEKDALTAPELARQFEVSRRTINRDIEDLSRAGFPIVTRQGSGGGISLMEGFRFDRKAIRPEEMDQIVTGLKGLGSVASDSRIDHLLSRLHGETEHTINIDLSSFYKESLSEKIELFNRAIDTRSCVEITYYSPYGEESRLIEPMKIHYRWSDWYLFGFCRKRNDFRMFKLNRLWHHRLTEQQFERRDLPAEREEPGGNLKDENPLEVLFDKSVKHVLVESYGPSSFEETEDGKLLFRRGYSNREYMVRWLLQFGDKALVLEPESMAKEIRDISSKILKNYENLKSNMT